MTLKYTGLLLLALQILSVGNSSGEIRNGYEVQLQNTITSLQRLNSLLADDCSLPREQRDKIRSRIAQSVRYITCYELTAELIDQLRIISPGIYNEMDSLKDKRGRPTDIYIRLVQGEEATIPHYAASFFRPAISIDADANLSEYGEFSVSVNIWTTDNALMLLCHELGHAKYIVPNLASYSEFYRRHYSNPYLDLSFMGHHHKDESGRYSKVFEKRFLDDRSYWLKNGGTKPGSLYSLAQKVRKNIRNGDLNRLYPRQVPSVARGHSNTQSQPAR